MGARVRLASPDCPQPLAEDITEDKQQIGSSGFAVIRAGTPTRLANCWNNEPLDRVHL